MRNYSWLLGPVLVFGCCLGCGAQRRVDLAARTGGNAFLFGQFQAFDGTSGRPLSFADMVDRCRHADVVLLGEEHGDAICNQIEAQLLHALLDARRPLMLAMEFFEADTQAALDAYLTERLDEPEFLEQTDKSAAYLKTHRPLIELARAAHLPVTAANAPRRLVTGYRKSALTYEEYRAGLDAEDRRWLPVSCGYLWGPYRERFAAIMEEHGGGPPTSQPETQSASQPAPASQPLSEASTQLTTAPVSQPASQPLARPASQPVTRPASEPPAGMPASMPTEVAWQDFYKAQLLWDQAMAESVANLRDRFPAHRVLLIVGGFHVAQQGGTTLKLMRRRPHDRLLTIVYRGNPNGQFAFREEDRGVGDVIVYGLAPPKPETMPMPGRPTATQPTSTQAASAPTTVPASAPKPTSAASSQP